MKYKKSWILFYLLVVAGMLLLVQGGGHSIRVIAEHTPIPRSHCIIIDAGHGGIDGGATSCTGVLESTLNLEIALRLNDLIHLMGYDTYMIRTTDTSIHTSGQSIAQIKVSDLKERVRIVNETENALLLSIHQNNFTQPQYSGAQVFYAGAGESEALAKNMQTALVQHLAPDSKRQSKQSKGVYLMEHIDCTGILIECGFLSNPQEEAKLRSADYQKQLCAVIAVCVSSFLSNT